MCGTHVVPRLCLNDPKRVARRLFVPAVHQNMPTAPPCGSPVPEPPTRAGLPPPKRTKKHGGVPPQPSGFKDLSLAQLRRGAIADSTYSQYTYMVESYLRITPDPWPATPAKREAFLLALLRAGHNGKTAAQYVSGVHTWSHVHGHGTPEQSLHIAVRGANRMAPAPPPIRARPITYAEFRVLSASWDPDPIRERVRRLLMTGVHLALRLGEVIALRQPDITRGVSDPDDPAFTVRIALRATKAEQTVTVYKNLACLAPPPVSHSAACGLPHCPSHALWSLSQDSTITNAPLWPFTSAVYGEKMRELLKARLKMSSEDIEATTGHSLRRTGSQLVYAATQDLALLRHHLRWRSGYMEQRYLDTVLQDRAANVPGLLIPAASMPPVAASASQPPESEVRSYPVQDQPVPVSAGTSAQQSALAGSGTPKLGLPAEKEAARGRPPKPAPPAPRQTLTSMWRQPSARPKPEPSSAVAAHCAPTVVAAASVVEDEDYLGQAWVEDW